MAQRAVRVYLRSIQQHQLWHKCKKFLSRRLLFVNVGVNCALYTVGDLVQQRIEGSKQINWKRTGRMATLGLFIGPVNHYWYLFLDRAILGHGAKMVGKKVLADQMVMAPICCTVFYIGMCLLEGGGTADIKAELQEKFWPTYKTDWKLWPAAQVINFYFVPPLLRVTYVNVVTLIWTTYLSYMKHKTVQTPQDYQSSLTQSETVIIRPVLVDTEVRPVLVDDKSLSDNN